MTFAYDHNPTRVTALTHGPDAIQVELDLDLDPAHWPWMILDPHHPVVVEKLEYLGGMAALLASGGLSKGQGSALTQLTWSIGDERPGGHATRAVVRLLDSFAALATGEGKFELSSFDAAGVRIVDLVGAGVVFDARDSGARRAASKAKAKAAVTGGPVPFVDPIEVGLPADGVSFLGPLEDGACQALVATEKGFHPGHPFHTGSGDHVNVGHLVDVAFQFAHLVIGRPLTWLTGAAQFRRFVELDVPFVVKLEEHRPGDTERLVVSVHQLDRPCAELRGTFRVVEVPPS